jgi:hypothetical protein
MKPDACGDNALGTIMSLVLDPEVEERSTDVNLRQLREFSAIWLVSFCTMGFWKWFANSNSNALMVLCAVGLLVGLPGLVRPTLAKPVFSFAMALSFPIGWVATRLLLGFLFFLLFTPVAWLFRMLQHDPLHIRKLQPTSYWSQVQQPSDAQSYFRQSL